MEANKGRKGEALSSLSSSGRKRPRPVKSIPGRTSRPHAYRAELRRRAVQLFVEEQLPAELVAKELGVSDKSVYAWARRYRKDGEAGLQGRVPGPKGSRLPEAVKKKITELKQESPHWGVKRLAQTLKRLFCMKASPKAVRRHLKAVKLPLVKVKRRRKPQPPERRFERSTPNQMWQSDITYYPIQGKMAYIIGFIDDYSRYITGLGLYRSQTSENVVETYRTAVAECGVPKEMLTDNGRQYTTWRGVTKFQRELKKDHIHHIRSATKHPETLGKIERFWQSLKEDFLSRARFETFEEARERLAYWVKYYNHKRPHQGLDGACPADRFFSIEKEMRAAIERGVAANVEEMALHGTPKQPFYMVGRVGGKSVVIETDEKTMSVMLDGQELNAGQAMLYAGKKGVEDEAGRDLSDRNSETENKGVQRQGENPGGAVLVEREAERLGADEGTARAVGHSKRMGETGTDRDTDGAGPEVEAEGGRAALAAGATGETDGTDGEPGAAGRDAGGSTELRKETSHEGNGTGKVRSDGKMPGCPGGVDGAEKGLGTMSGDESERFAVLSVAGSGGIGYVGGIGAAGNEGGRGRAGVADADQTSSGPEDPGAGTAGDGASGFQLPSSGQEPSFSGHALARCGLMREVSDVERGRRCESQGEAESYTGSAFRADDGHGSGGNAQGKPEDLLRVAGPGTLGDASGADGSARWPTAEASGSGKGATPTGTGGSGKRPTGVGGAVEDPGNDPADSGSDGARRVV